MMDVPQIRPSTWTARHVAWGTVVVALVVLGAWLLYETLAVVLLLFTALVLSTALSPLVRVLQRLRMGRVLAAATAHLASLVMVVAVGYLVAPLAVEQITKIVQSLPGQYETFRSALLDSPHRLLVLFGRGLPENLAAWVNGDGPTQRLEGLAVLWEVTAPILGVLFVVLAVFLLSFYWTLEGQRTIRSLLLLVPAQHRHTAQELADEIQTKLGAFVRGQAVLCLAVGAMALLAYWMIGLPYAPSLALVAGVLEAIPVLGPILGTVPAALVGLSIGWEAAVWAVGANIVIAAIESYLLVPRLMDRSVGVHPVVTLLAITTLFALLGPIGGVLAVPIAAIVQLLLRRFVVAPAPPSRALDGDRRDHGSVLLYRTHELLYDLRARRNGRGRQPDGREVEAAEEAVESVALGLSRVLRRAEAAEEAS